LIALALAGTWTLPEPAAAARPTCFGQRATVVGTAGNDHLVGTTGNDVIVGKGGDDEISGGRGNDLICGNSGDDGLIGGRGDDKIHGGKGSDSVSYTNAPAGVSVDLRITSAQDTHAAGRDVIRSAEILLGSSFGDVIRGGATSEVLFGMAGDDTVNGGAGDVDLILGGAGDDTLSGGGGVLDSAVFLTAPGAVTASLLTGVSSGEGEDSLAGFESIVGSQFDDDLTGGPSLSLLFGALGDDTLRGGSQTRAFAAYLLSSGPVVADLGAGTVDGEGADTLVELTGVIGSDYADELTGGSASETLVGWSNGDTLAGQGGADVLLGFDGADSLSGGSGDDRLSGGQGGDQLVGGEGQDLAAFDQSASGVNVDLAAGQANEGGNDTLGTIENVIGSRFADTITGNALANRLLGMRGGDTISGGGGDDQLDGGLGTDSLDGGLGTDVCISAETALACESTTAPTSAVASRELHAVRGLAGAATRIASESRGRTTPPRHYARPTWAPTDSRQQATTAATVAGRVGTWSVPTSPKCDGSALYTFPPEVTPAYQGAGNPYPTQRVWFHPWYWDPGLGRWVEGGWYYTWARNAVSGTGQVQSLYDPFFGFSHIYLDLQTSFVSWFNDNGFPLAGWDYYKINYLGTYYVWFQIIWMPNGSWPYQGEIGSYVTLDVRDWLDFNIGYSWGCVVS
jgi:Ca2+-binding RTX toxin-like protein